MSVTGPGCPACDYRAKAHPTTAAYVVGCLAVRGAPDALRAMRMPQGPA